MIKPSRGRCTCNRAKEMLSGTTTNMDTIHSYRTLAARVVSESRCTSLPTRSAKEQVVPHAYVHFFGARGPLSAAGYCKRLLEFIKKEEYGDLAADNAMDRDKRWERAKIAVNGLVEGEGENWSWMLSRLIMKRYYRRVFEAYRRQWT
ncbi:hypothetical protein BT96DRAFT_1001007 [Gymnopus androsaceus JB14]|uniref:BPG-independent PGAM N-terminal domain-containing protein n=1 Tax=Gymnopus androsaceus JB14 TaxID=1447944 RepID=A0A6A4H297_9AGAR|nr:hypothetical protein BT96DRAFT_1001007 [Gymnopus androsaceus JB14]